MNPKNTQSIVAMIAVSFVCGWLLGSGRFSSNDEVAKEKVVVTTTVKAATSTSSTTTTENWNPQGYVVVAPEEGIAVRWLDPKEFDCDYYDWCWGMEVLSRWGCPSSLYAEINMKNKNGTNIGWTNDSTQRLGAGDKAILIFGTYESESETAELADISCY